MRGPRRGTASHQETIVKKTPKNPKQLPLDWEPVRDALGDVLEWGLDIAVALCRDSPEEVESVENVRDFLRAKIDGDRASVRVDDLMFTIALIFGAIDVDLGLDGSTQAVVHDVASALGVGRVGGTAAPVVPIRGHAPVGPSIRRPPSACAGCPYIGAVIPLAA
jgi:hypothetical protein